jgi:flagellin
MVFSINSNLPALGAQRSLGFANAGLSKTLQSLSSGKRINQAADDAAGLAISTGMLSQIMGMSQASANAQDSVSMIQTADGALGESTDVLQRMRELAVQSSNGTYSQSDRGAIQAEFSQLQAELDSIGGSTQFNGRNLLDGSSAATATATPAQATIQANGRVGNAAPARGDMIASVAVTAGSGAATSTSLQLQLVAGQAGGNTVDMMVTGSDGSSQRILNASALTSTTQNFTIGGANVAVSFGNVPVSTQDVGAVSLVQLGSSGAAVTTDKSLNFAVGANPGQGIQTGFGDARASTLNVEGLTVLGANEADSQAKSQNAIAAIDQALHGVGMQRATLGAVQNRMGYTIANLDTASENLSASNSRIQDADFAKASSDLARWQIQNQVAVAMLGQANLHASNVLNLLK